MRKESARRKLEPPNSMPATRTVRLHNRLDRICQYHVWITQYRDGARRSREPRQACRVPGGDRLKHPQPRSRRRKPARRNPAAGSSLLCKRGEAARPADGPTFPIGLSLRLWGQPQPVYWVKTASSKQPCAKVLYPAKPALEVKYKRRSAT